MPKITKNKIIFDGDDWLSDVDYLSTDQNYQRSSNHLAKANSFDPIRAYGYAQPGFLPAASTNANLVTNYLVNGIAQGSDTAYTLSTDGKIFQITSTAGNGTVTNGGSFPKTIAGASPSGSDCVKYYVDPTTPTEYFFYSYSTSSFWDVGRYDFSATFADTYMSATAATPLANPDRSDGAGFPHPLIVGDNNIMYIGDRNYVHAFNGLITGNGTYYSRVLDLPKGYVITAFVNYEFYLVIFAYKNTGGIGNLSQAKAFFWDTFSSSFTFVKDLNANYVSEAVNYQDTMVCFTYGSLDGFYNSNSQMQIFDGNIFKIVKKGFNSIPIRGGVQVVGDNIFFNSGATIYAYRGLDNKKSFQEIYTGSNDSYGMLRSFGNGYNLHFSTGGSGLRSFRNNYNSSALVYTKVVEPEFPEFMQGRIKSVTVVYQKATSGGRDFSLDFLTDVSSNNLITGKTTVTNLIERYRNSNTNLVALNGTGFKQLQLYLTWGAGSGSGSAPAISRVEFEYELINIPNN